MSNIVFRKDPLAELKTASTYQEKLAVVHEVLKKRFYNTKKCSTRSRKERRGKTLKTFKIPQL